MMTGDITESDIGGAMQFQPKYLLLIISKNLNYHKWIACTNQLTLVKWCSVDCDEDGKHSVVRIVQIASIFPTTLDRVIHFQTRESPLLFESVWSITCYTE